MPIAETTPQPASSNVVMELLIGMSVTVNNVHTFIVEESHRVIDHVNSEMQKLHDRLNQLDSIVQKLQSILSAPVLDVDPISAVAPAKTNSPSGV